MTAAWTENGTVRRLSVAVLAALALSLLLTLLSGTGAETGAGRLGGDHPAFYAAGRIASDEGLDAVNDLDHLEAAQADLFPGEEGEGFLTWAYPPHVALVYQPLSALPYRASYALHTALMVAAFVGAVHLARPLLPWLGAGRLPAVAAGLAFYPMFRGIGAGQNTALTLLLLVAAWRASAEDRDGWAGVALGLLLFKPQFAALAVVMWLLAGRWRVLPTFAALAAGTWAVTAALAGGDWVSRYLDDLDAYRATEHVNEDNHVALPEIADTIFGVPLVGWVVAAVVAGLLAVQWWRARGGADLVVPIAALAAALLLCAAHAVFYDVGLVLVTAAVGVQRGAYRFVAALLLAGFLDPLKAAIGFNPLGLVLVAWFGLALSWVTTLTARPADATLTS